MSESIKENSDSLIDLLTDQCVELENLLSLAREETLAAQSGNFGAIMGFVSEREKIGKKLETFQRQISELRGCLDTNLPKNISAHIVEITNMTLAQDRKTTRLLNASREEAKDQLNDLALSEKNTNAYTQERRKGLAYDKKI